VLLLLKTCRYLLVSSGQVLVSVVVAKDMQVLVSSGQVLVSVVVAKDMQVLTC